jgi:hypothetical protein
MTPQPVIIAAQTDRRPPPGIILSLLGNLLENDGNKMYHYVAGYVVGELTPRSKRAGSSAKLSAQPL